MSHNMHKNKVTILIKLYRHSTWENHENLFKKYKKEKKLFKKKKNFNN